MAIQQPVREAPAPLPGKGNDATRPTVPEPVLNVDNIQGNILAGFNKDHQTHLYLRIHRAANDSSQMDPEALASFRAWLGRLVPYVATTNEVLRFNRLFKEIRRRRCAETRTVQATWVNVALSFAAVKALGGDGVALRQLAERFDDFKNAKATEFSADLFADKAFKSGMPNRSIDVLGDPPDPVAGQTAVEGNRNSWVFGGPEQEPDVVVIVASDSIAELAAEVGRIEDTIYSGRPGPGSFAGSGVTVVYKQHGNTLPPPLTGHEHFGFLDGVSQPGVRGIVSQNPFDLLTIRQNPQEPTDQGKPGQDVLWPGEFVFGYSGQDPNGKAVSDEGPNSLTGALPGNKPPPAGTVPAGPVWAKDGSYLVVRRLRQDVPRFHQFLRDQGAKLGISDELLGAKLVGRWKSGAPILRADKNDIPALGNDDCANNHFEFGSASTAIPKQVKTSGVINEDGLCSDDKPQFPQSPGDKTGDRCPFAGHIRKSYPRDDTGTLAAGIGEVTTQTHRLLRRGIPFGDPFFPAPDPANELDTGCRGLLFACYQTSITRQFEFVTQNWVNNPEFKDKSLADGTLQSGHDLIIGQSNQNGRARRCRVRINGADKFVDAGPADEWVIPTGGGYFFAPSIDALCLLTGTKRT